MTDLGPSIREPTSPLDKPDRPVWLVLADRFPALNQPWIDTYLEQLLRCGVEPLIVSQNFAPDRYDPKVDTLRLRDRVRFYDPDASVALKRAFLALRREPRAALGGVASARFLAKTEVSWRGRLGVIARGVGLTADFPGSLMLAGVHAHSLRMAFDFLPWIYARRLPLVLTFHGLEPNGVPQVAAYRRMVVFEHARCVVVNTAFARAHAIELGCPPEKIVILPQGLPLDAFPFRPRLFPEPSAPVEILSVGRFHRDKGQRYALLALRRLMDQGVRVRWRFVGVGPDLDALRRLADRLSISQHVQFDSGLSSAELRTAYQRAHLFVLASIGSAHGAEHVETQGVVIQEAQATGCIPIATRVGGIPDCIVNGVDGILVEERSHRAIASAIDGLMSSPARWADMQIAGRRTVETRFAASVIGSRMADLLREVSRSSAYPT